MMNAGMNDQELQLKIDAYGDMLFKLSYIRLQNVQDAEDVVQETFYQYVKKAGTFESPEHEKAWLLKVTMNACRKVWRSAWKRHQCDWQQDKADDRQQIEPVVPGPEEGTFQKEERRRLMGLVMALPAKYRDVIHLFYYEELSVKEIALVTGRAESTVTSQLTRGRKMLKKSLKEEYDFG